MGCSTDVHARPWNEAVPVISYETSPTFPDVPCDDDDERALRRDLVLLTAQHRLRRRRHRQGRSF
jgi:hypothetical protein